MTKRSSYWSLFWFLLAMLTTLGLRFWGLGEKPPHHDETINGWFVTQMWQIGYFKYDPTNYHGPLLFYLFQWLEPIFGSSIQMMRGVTSFFSVMTVGLFLYFGIFKNRILFVAGAAVLAFSPAAEFFAHSAIHESVLVFFGALTLFGFLVSEAFLPIVLVGWLGMLLLKETWVLWLISIGVAFALSGIWKDPGVQKAWQAFRINQLVRQKALRWLGACGVVLVLFYSGFFQDPYGILNFFKAFLPWTKVGVSGAGHEKGFGTWFYLLKDNEIPTVLFLLVNAVGLFVQSHKVRFFSWMSLTHFLLYSLIPYKTPWCLITIQMPLIFSGVLVMEEVLERFQRSYRLKMGSTIFLCALSLWPLPQLKRLNWDSPIQLDHPYVYVQTHYDIKLLIEHLDRAAGLVSLQKIQIATAETWPFPWLLRKYPLLSYGTATMPPDLEAGVILYDVSQVERLRPLLKATHWERIMQVRQSREAAVVFIRRDLLDRVGVF